MSPLQAHHPRERETLSPAWAPPPRCEGPPSQRERERGKEEIEIRAEDHTDRHSAPLPQSIRAWVPRRCCCYVGPTCSAQPLLATGDGGRGYPGAQAAAVRPMAGGVRATGCQVGPTRGASLCCETASEGHVTCRHAVAQAGWVGVGESTDARGVSGSCGGRWPEDVLGEASTAAMSVLVVVLGALKSQMARGNRWATEKSLGLIH